MVVFAMSLPSPTDFHGRFSDYSFLRKSDEVIYNDEAESHGFSHVYIFVFVPKGNGSKQISFVRRHSASEGSWPVHYSVNDFYAAELTEMLGGDYQCLGHSYALMRW